MTDKEIELRNDASRLSWALKCHADPATIEALAKLLNYNPAQLATDIAHLDSYVSDCRQAEREAGEYD